MNDKTDDAFTLWQQMVGEMQKGFGAFGNTLSTAPADDKPSDPAGTAPGRAQQRLADLMESYLAGMNLPSRAQLAGMSDRLQAIESELIDIKALLHEALMNSRPLQAAPRPPKLRPKRASGPSAKPQAAAPTAKGES